MHWIQMQKEKGSDQVERQVMSLIRHTFSDLSIPNPSEFHIYPWSNGCSYWTPGSYDVEAVCQSSRSISKRIYACGESLNHCQAWVESALESTNQMLAKLD
jgi:monoamine oxidase